MAKVEPSSVNSASSVSARREIGRGYGERSHPRAFSIFVTASLILTDVTMMVLAFWLGGRFAFDPGIFGSPGPLVNGDHYLVCSVAIGIMVVWFALSGLYAGRRGASRLDDSAGVTIRVVLAVGLSLGVLAFVRSVDLSISRHELVFATGLSVIGVSMGRFIHTGIVGALRSRGFGAARLLIVGAGPTGQIVLDKVRRSPNLGFDLVGIIRHRPWPAGERLSEIDGVPVLGTSNDLPAIVERYGVDEVVVALSGVAHEEILDVALHLSDFPVEIRVYPDTFRLITSDVLSISDLNGLPTVRVRTIGLRPVERVAKRMMDVAISSIVLVLFAPLMLLIALAIKLSSPGPVFFVQERVGQDGKSFRVLKFRSMPVDAEDETGPVFAQPDDSRPTRLGHFMRRYSIDELPQFINVFLGEMSIVGPRPERPYFVEQFRHQIPAYMTRHQEKSGITGWAQVNGFRGDTSIEERTRYDLYYVENWSIFFDLKIMLKTLAHVARRDNNAY